MVYWFIEKEWKSGEAALVSEHSKDKEKPGTQQQQQNPQWIIYF